MRNVVSAYLSLQGILAVALISCVLVPQAQAQQQRPYVESVALAENLHMLTVKQPDGVQLGVNMVVWVDAAKHAVLVDCPFRHPYLVQITEDKIKQDLGATDVRFHFNTHYHPDHSGCNGMLAPEATTIAHQNVYEMLRKGTTAVGLVNPGDTLVFTPAPESQLPELTFTDTITMQAGTIAIQAMHFANSHTDGDAVILIDEGKVVHLGDLFWGKQFPSVDTDNGGNVAGLAKSIGEIIDRLPVDAQLISGHAPLATVADLKAYHQMLMASIAIVQKQLDQGKSLLEIQQQAETLFGEWKTWEHDLVPDRTWAELLYKSLAEDT